MDPGRRGQSDCVVRAIGPGDQQHATAEHRADRQPVQVATYDRREPLLYTGIVIYLTTGLSLAIALLFS